MVATVIALPEKNTDIEQMHTRFKAQRDAFNNAVFPDYQVRRERLLKLKSALLRQQDAIIEAINLDFAGRSADETLLADIMPSIQAINYALKNLKGWMKPKSRRVHALFMPARNHLMYQPLGVIGIIVPWNYPINLAIGPLTGALAAGNRAMLKMSEYTPRTSGLLQKIIAETFTPDLVTVVTGEADIAAEFSGLPFDHLLFTGSTNVGRHVMRAAAENLTPVTLELGGKSPAIVSADVPLEDAATRLAFGKSFNAGQTCIAPDYVLCPEERIAPFVEAFSAAFAKMYPSIKDNSDYTSIINDRQYRRLQDYLTDAQAKGATLIQLNPANEVFDRGTRKLPLTLVLNATDKMKLMQEEIFGPILPIVATQGLDQALSYVNERPRPLALYFFGYNKAQQKKVLQQSHSGGVSLNDTLVHFAQDDMPFGGVGDSGMGHYHGHEGFLTFSNVKGVHVKQRLYTGSVIFPPHGTVLHQIIYKIFNR
ncbi:coniferyl aldehyde dehydrogenase [Allohahella marinimesophila]|uniref:Aldehyde dehydrogenase n=1 Tax=Allohahella marinimesophila TaxID=1054972 RepID=A0ABP7PUQ1_9GAMM